MWGLLWLTYERTGHPEAVCHGATEEEVRFVLGLLEKPELERREMTGALRRYVLEETERVVFERRLVPVRGNDGIYRLVGWRLGKWLMHVLPAREESLRRVMAEMQGWLGRRSGVGRENLTMCNEQY